MGLGKIPTKKINLNRLNAKQREAATFGQGPLLILAGAGSGKTSTMTHRIAYLIAEKSVLPSQVLGLSFTNKAASELKDRVKSLLKESVGSLALHGLTVCTFHSLCVRILREFAPKIGFTKNFTILDPGDQESIVREILKSIRIDDRKFDPSWILFQIGQAKNKMMNDENAQKFFDTVKGPKVAYDDYSIALSSVYPRYRERLQQLDAMDFDDLLIHAVTLLETDVETRATLNHRYRYILVDEYQDTNPAQFRLLKALTEKSQNICVVGDDDQSIYGWRGADPNHILEFHHHFPGTKTLILDQNYRSTNSILKAANSVIQKNEKRFDKSLWSQKGDGNPIHLIAVEDDRAEATHVVETLERIKTDRQFRWNDFAILYRSNAQSRLFEEVLRGHLIPYRLVGGLSFLDRKEVKDTLAYWRIVIKTSDDLSLRRIINWPARGVGKKTFGEIAETALAKECSWFSLLPDYGEKLNRLHQSTLSIRSRLETINRADFLTDEEFRQAVTAIARDSLNQFEIKKGIESDEADDVAKAQRKWESVEELAHAIGMFESSATAPQNGLEFFAEYLGTLSLGDREEKEKDTDEVTLMTLHAAKGLEFPVVFLVGLEDGRIPHQRTIDEAGDLSEERRLFYVGVTRAKTDLILTRCKQRIRYGKTIPQNPSRFLADLPPELVVEQDYSSTPEFKSKEAQDAHERAVMDFFAEFQKKLKPKA